MEKIGLFVTCLADVMRPSIGMAAARLIRACGGQVVYPPTQTCCGQIAFNSGYTKEAMSIIKKCAQEFAGCEKVVMPSGSCCGFFRKHLPTLTDDKRVLAFGKKCLELSEYLTACDYTPPVAKKTMTITYHDSCSGLRELNIKDAPRKLLKARGMDIVEMNECEECCGFGGRFAEQFAEVSVAMAEKKCQHILTAQAAGAQAVVGGDLGCLLQMEGWLRRHEHTMPVLHWAELVAEEA